MRINELFFEDQVDEVHPIIGKVANKVGRLGGAVRGSYHAAKQAFQQGHDTTYQKAFNKAGGSGEATQASQVAGSNSLAPDVGTATNNTPDDNTTQQATTPAQSSDTVTGDEVDSILQAVDKLDANGKQQVLTKIQSGKPEPATNVASNTQTNPFGSVVNSLKTVAPPETTSSGGTLKQTTTGQVHKANPNNPNNTQAPATAQTTPVQQTAGTSTLRSKAKKVKVGVPTGPSQAELDADHARLASGTNEGFYSRFLRTSI
jgi:hypothetical protein